MIPVIQLLLIYPALLLRGFVAHLVWGWFMVPLGVRSLSVYEAVGVFFVIAMFKEWPKDDKSAEDPWVELGAQAFRCVLYPMAALLFAWVWHAIGVLS